MSSNNIIQVIPIKNTTLTTMTTEILDINNKPETYTVKTSSYSDTNTQGFNAFNDDNDYWESDNVDNNTEPKVVYSNYTQSPYSGIIPSSYLGGGSDNNTFSTKVGPNKNKTEIPGVPPWNGPEAFGCGNPHQMS